MLSSEKINTFAASEIRNMKRRTFLYVVLMVAFFLQAKAQETIFRNFPAIEYKGGTQNWDIEQLPDGQMAFANNMGLLIFDGTTWNQFPICNYTTVRSLYYDRGTDRLYAGASGEFGYYQVDPFTYQYQYHSLSNLLPATQHNFGEIWNILPWGNKLVFQSKTHLFILDKQGKFQTFHPQYRIETIANIKGRLIMGTRRGLEEWRNSRTVALPGATFNNKVVARSILPYGKMLLIATQQNGILSYDGKQIHEDYSDLSTTLKNDQIFCAKLRKDKLAIGTVKAGLIVKDLRGGQNLFLNNSKGLINNTVLSTTFDMDGNIWLGLDNGISCALTNVPFQNVVSERASIGMGNTSVVFGNQLYLGTNQGLFVQNMPLLQQLYYRSPLPVNGITGQIWNLCIIDNTLLCCADLGLFCISNGQAQKIEGPDGVWEVCKLEKHPGFILAADYLGVVLLQKVGNTYKMIHRIKTDIESIGNLWEDTDGTLWSSHWQKGIYHLQLSTDMKNIKVLELFNGSNGLVMNESNLLCKIKGRLYVSCVDGLYKYDRNKRKMIYDKAISKIFNTYGNSLKITETPQGDLWAQKADYLAIAHAKGKKYVVDSTSYRGIVKTQQFGLGNIDPLPTGHTLINSNDGFYLVKDYNKMSAHNYPLFISKITATNDGDSIVYRHSHKESKKGKKITLPHSLNSIVIEFVSPEYVAEDAITYSCYLENYDNRWSTSLSNTKEYTQLSKGKYIFHIKAYNRISGKTQETSMEITVKPAWYETIWAYLIYMLLVCLALYELMRYLKFRADRELMIERTKRKAEVTQMQNEKLQTELKHKSSELASSTMSSIHQNDILQKIDEEMGLLSESVRREDKKAVVTSKINDIRNNLQSYLNNDEGWEKFEENFNVVYDDFMKKLTSQYTNLKTSDRKLCAYLRMGLSSKEMAALLNMSVRSIETARYRLRKKLSLESGENLTDFIQNFGS